MIKKFNISKPKKYTNSQGEEKTQWNNIGMITEFHKEDGSVSRIIEIPTIGLEANIFPFEPKKTEQDGIKSTPPGYMNKKVETIEYPEEEINPEDIPF